MILPPPIRLSLALVLGLGIGLVARAQSQAPVYPPLDAKGEAELAKQWRDLKRKRPDDSSRGLYGFILTALAHNWQPKSVTEAIDLVEQMHDRDKASAGYGNYRWYWHDTKPNDLNAVQFCMQEASLAWILYRDRLDDAGRAKLSEALALGSEGVVRQKVAVSYTNIFLMRAANAILIGESTGAPKLALQGKAWFNEWIEYVRANGNHEFSSPTYYGVDAEDLGSLVLYSQDPEVRDKASKALNFLWTDIAANWFEPHQGISGANSRDYGFLLGHGYLDQHLVRSGWIKGNVEGESRPVLDDITHVSPPPGLREQWGKLPRMVSQQYGPTPAERAFHYVGRHFSLGSAGKSYGAQDRMLALTFDGGPKQPIASFSLDYRNDPYGQGKIETSHGHGKLTHLIPLIASVQRGPEVLQVVYLDPAHTPNPSGLKEPIRYAGVWANLVLPAEVSVWTSQGPVRAGDEIPLPANAPVYLRSGSVVAAVRFVIAKEDTGRDAELSLIRDGSKLGAQRLSLLLAQGEPKKPVCAALWVRAAEDIDDEGFARFRAWFSEANSEASASEGDGLVRVSVPGLEGTLKLRLNGATQEVETAKGADKATLRGILNVNGTDVGGALLPPPPLASPR